METSREEHRRKAQEALSNAVESVGTPQTNNLLQALTEAVLALSAPTEERLEELRASAELKAHLGKQ
ncbi:hypothetical protein ACFYP4_02215 [Streptomyces sp. NPDC005551]|uniref:hypothetical protein n=1 Tax=Streptomyces sp. NPDC005551 TaxID=3364725 RepID=UPI00369532C9